MGAIYKKNNGERGTCNKRIPPQKNVSRLGESYTITEITYTFLPTVAPAAEVTDAVGGFTGPQTTSGSVT